MWGVVEKEEAAEAIGERVPRLLRLDDYEGGIIKYF